jgi:tRNA pseudouridine55 synthase
MISESKNLSGFILVDKPAGLTSMTVVRKVKRFLKVSQVGHLGTLDPFATGVLPVMVGNATRLSDSVMDGRKGYDFSVALGSETDTLDTEGKVVSEAPIPDAINALIIDALPSFRGSILQIPPVYSAIKMDGLCLYEHMRRHGELPQSIETKARKIDVFEIELLGVRAGADGGPVADLRVLCGKGTYVRCLARDIARSLGTVGHCVALRRTFVEPWSVKQCLRIDDVTEDDLSKAFSEGLHAPEDLVPEMPVGILLAEKSAKSLAVGNAHVVAVNDVHWVRNEQITKDASFAALMRTDAGLMFLCEARAEPSIGWYIQPRKMVSS